MVSGDKHLRNDFENAKLPILKIVANFLRPLNTHQTRLPLVAYSSSGARVSNEQDAISAEPYLGS